MSGASVSSQEALCAQSVQNRLRTAPGGQLGGACLEWRSRQGPIFPVPQKKKPLSEFFFFQKFAFCKPRRFGRPQMPIRSPFPKPGTRVSQKNGAGGPENSALVTKFFGWAFFVFVMCLGVAPLVPTIGRNDSAETSFLLLWSRELRILRYLGGSNIDLASTYMHFPTLPLFPFPICAHAHTKNGNNP